MRSIHVRAAADADGELRLVNLPIQKGDNVEAIVMTSNGMSVERQRIARDEFLKHALSGAFCSSGPYPSREELHERH